MIKNAAKFVSFTIFADEMRTKVRKMKNTLLIKRKQREKNLKLLT